MSARAQTRSTSRGSGSFSDNARRRRMSGAVLLAILSGCGREQPSDPGAVISPTAIAQLRVEPADSLVIVGLGATSAVRATAVTATGERLEGVDVTWTVDDPTVASLASATTKSGDILLFTAIGRGRTTLRAAAGQKSATIPLTVRAEVQRVVVSAAQVTLGPVGQTTQVSANVEADRGVATTVAWATGNPGIVSVGATSTTSGQAVTLTAVGAGTSHVIARSAADTSKFVSIAVTVPPPIVQHIQVTPAAVTITRGASTTLSASVIVQAGGSSDVSWRSADPTIATVSPDRTASGGTITVTALRPGNTRIIAASVQDPSRTATSDVVVPTPVVSSVVLSLPSVAMSPFGTAVLSATVTAIGGASTDVFWRSSNPSIVTVSTPRGSSGSPVTLTAVSVGQATIRAVSVEDSTNVATLPVSVTAPGVQSIRLSAPSATIVRGTTGTFSATVTAPAGVVTDIAWRSDDASVATVSPSVTPSGATVTVTALSPGTTRVYAASVQDPTIAASSLVTVPLPQVSAVTAAPGTLPLSQYESAPVTASVVAGTGAVTDVYWRSSDPAVVTVGSGRSASGAPVTITAIAPGQAVLRALSAEDTTKSATIAVTVGPPAVAAVAVTLGATTLDIGMTTQAQVRLTDLRGNLLTGRGVTWTSGSPAVATVSATGLVTAIGYGTVTIRAASGGTAGSATLVVQPRFASVTAGNNHTCALSLAGEMWCFGYNIHGPFGVGTRLPTFSLPLLRAFPGAPPFAQVNVGNAHTCGRTAAGAIWCAGDNQGASLLSTVPVALSGAPVFTQISGNNRHHCGVTATGAAWCWGSNALGQLGDGTNSDRSVPVAVLGGHLFTVVRAGFNHSCGITTAGDTWCWGYNQYGQLGNGSTAPSFTPVRVMGGLALVDVQVGAMHTCGRTAAGAIWCWGANFFGQLGNGTTTDALSPVQVQGSGPAFDEFSLTSNHACARSDTSVRCWGWNRSGGLGNGGITDALTPVPVSSTEPFISVSAGNTHSCALSTAGRLWCWGGSTTALPDGTVANTAVPVLMR